MWKIIKTSFIVIIGLFFLTACVSMPTGPGILVLPGSNKNFDQFRYDDHQCRHFAYEQIGGVTPNKASISSGATSAAVGAALGATAGALIGGGKGAAIGAGGGLLTGGMVGTATATTSGYISQQQYDASYVQCMYAHGHRVPVYGQFTEFFSANKGGKDGNIPPPPPGNPPPPPSFIPPPPPGNPPPSSFLLKK